jgi:hypothetical protein
MLSLLHLGPEPLLGPTETSDHKVRPREVRAPLSNGFLLFLACLTYVISKFIASGGATALDQPEYWLLGLVPLFLTHTASRFTVANEHASFAYGNFYTLSWIASLLWFLFLRTTLLSELFEFPLYRLFNYQMMLPYLLLSCAYTLLGYGTMLLVLAGRRIGFVLPAFGVVGLCCGFLLSSILFYVLLLFHRV